MLCEKCARRAAPAAIYADGRHANRLFRPTRLLRDGRLVRCYSGSRVVRGGQLWLGADACEEPWAAGGGAAVVAGAAGLGVGLAAGLAGLACLAWGLPD